MRFVKGEIGEGIEISPPGLSCLRTYVPLVLTSKLRLEKEVVLWPKK